MSLREAFADAYDTCMHVKGRCLIADIVRQAQAMYPALFQAESTHLIYQASVHAAKAFMRQSGVQDASLDLDEEEEQLDLPLSILPGLRPPKALAIPYGKQEYLYVRYDCATWADLEGAQLERTTNVERATVRLHDHLLKMATLEPYLRPYPSRTVREACAIMEKETEGQ